MNNTNENEFKNSETTSSELDNQPTGSNIEDKVVDQTSPEKSGSDDSLPVESNSGLTENLDLGKIQAGLDELSKMFEMKLLYDKSKDEMIDKLHRELQGYKNDLYKKWLSPVLNEIILLYDEYSKIIEGHKATDTDAIDVAKLMRNIGSLPEELEDVLYKNGVEPFEAEGEFFDPIQQKVVKTITTDDQSKEKMVCERLKKGFKWDGKLLRQEYISCYKYQSAQQ